MTLKCCDWLRTERKVFSIVICFENNNEMKDIENGINITYSEKKDTNDASHRGHNNVFNENHAVDEFREFTK